MIDSIESIESIRENRSTTGLSAQCTNVTMGKERKEINWTETCDRPCVSYGEFHLEKKQVILFCAPRTSHAIKRGIIIF